MNTVTETATVSLGMNSAHGVVCERKGPYTTVRFGNRAEDVATGREVIREIKQTH